MRNRTVQSVLARRSMNNGGMVAPPTQASGILRSSPSLIDAVSNDALSDMGGGTLSMAQGGAAVNMQPSYVFNQGGIARFAGGVVAPMANIPKIKPNMAEVGDDDSSQFTIDSRNRGFLLEALSKRAEEASGRTVGMFDTKDDPAWQLSDTIDYMFGSAADAPKRAAEREAEDRKILGEQSDARNFGLDTYLAQVGAPEDVIEYYQNKENVKKDSNALTWGLGNADFSSAEKAEKEDADVGMGLSGPTQDYLDAQSGMAAVGDGGLSRSQEVDESGFTEDSIPAESPLEAGVADGDLSLEEVPSPQSVVPGTGGGEDSVAKPAVVAGEKPSVAGEGPTTDGFGEFGTEYDESVDPVAAKVAEILESSKVDAEGKEVSKTKQDYIKEFKEDMPEYEGMSEEEKGFTIMEAGLRVMAGKSPNAVANIAEGLKGISKEFVKDKKAKRVYDQQIDLSAAKYGLQNLAKDRASLAAEAKEGRQLFKKVFRVAPGKTYKLNGEVLPENSSVILTVDQIKENGIDNLITETLLAKKISAQSKKAKSALDLIKGSVLTPDKFRATEKIYFDNVTRVGHNTATRGMLNQALVAISKNDGEEIVGGQAVMKDLAFRIANATGTSDQLAKILESPDAKAKYVAWTNSATTKFITGIIMEGGKITEQERAMARELSGAIGDGIFDGTVKGAGIITEKLKRFADSLGKDTENRLKQMEVTEQNWTEIYPTLKKATGKYGDYASGIRKAKGPIGRSGGNRAFIKEGLTWKNIVTRDADGNMTGLKKNWNK